jgi:outer membrane biosynthesis protein TonB
VQAQIEAALRANPKTRNAILQVQVRLWADSSGRVNRVQMVTSTGDSVLDEVLRSEILERLVLREPPPKDMPMPIVTRITERKSG